MNKTLFLVASLGLLGACGTDNNKAVDAPANTTSTVKVVASCTGVADADIGATITAGGPLMFMPNTATIAAGKYVKFTSTSNHNMINQPGASAANTFSSGAVGSHTSCLQFTVAGSYPWMCLQHGMSMTGTLTVN